MSLQAPPPVLNISWKIIIVSSLWNPWILENLQAIAFDRLQWCFTSLKMPVWEWMQGSALWVSIRYLVSSWTIVSVDLLRVRRNCKTFWQPQRWEWLGPGSRKMLALSPTIVGLCASKQFVADHERGSALPQIWMGALEFRKTLEQDLSKRYITSLPIARN